MKGVSTMNLSALLASLEPLDPDTPLVFVAGDREIGAGYHVTELRHSISTGIDCSGNIDRWQEARLQLLDGTGKTHMSAGKFTDILRKSLGWLPELSQAPLLVEFSPGNKGLKLKNLEEPFVQNGRVTIRLRDTRATCKPAHRIRPPGAPGDACCGETTSANACCGPATPSAAHDACCA